MKPLFISCHTPDQLYTESAMRLKASLEKFGLEYEIHTYQPLGTWRDNCSFKPYFIKSMLDKHRGRPVVWVDADAEVVIFPELFQDIMADVAAGYKDDEFLAATVYFANNQATRGLVKLWLATMQAGPPHKLIEQTSLRDAIEYLLNKGLITFERLPFEYVNIFDAFPQGPPVILQHQLSRQGRVLYGP